MMRIVVIEDDKAILDATLRILKSAGFDVLTAERGEPGLELWREHGADLLIADLRLPDIDGIAVVRQVRRESPRQAILTISGDPTNYARLRREIPGLAPVGFLQKPFARTELLSAVDDTLSASLPE
jgi:DNA-binding response OmpR family regulator